MTSSDFPSGNRINGGLYFALKSLARGLAAVREWCVSGVAIIEECSGHSVEGDQARVRPIFPNL